MSFSRILMKRVLSPWKLKIMVPIFEPEDVELSLCVNEHALPIEVVSLLNFHQSLSSLFLLYYMKPIQEIDQFNPVTLHPSALPKPEKANSYTHLKSYPWQMFFQELFFLEDGTSVFRAGKDGPVLFCIHGAGHSALSFATLALQAKKFSTVLAYDMRAHGSSKKQYEGELDMSIQTLVADCSYVLQNLIGKFKDQNFIIVGHSLGGSIAARLAQKINNDDYPQVVGVVIIDVVQGTALQALPFMMKILDNRPKKFSSVEECIHWSLSSRTLQNKQSARISMQQQLVKTQQSSGKSIWQWKIPLQKTEKHWKGWFEGLSKCFLNIKISKILFTAEKQRLDSQLIVAQMQGKFRLQVIRNVGHSVQQDDPQATAKAIYDFMKIFKIPPTPSQSQKKSELGLAKYKPQLKSY